MKRKEREKRCRMFYKIMNKKIMQNKMTKGDHHRIKERRNL